MSEPRVDAPGRFDSFVEPRVVKAVQDGEVAAAPGNLVQVDWLIPSSLKTEYEPKGAS
jgi:hypothetical protein